MSIVGLRGSDGGSTGTIFDIPTMLDRAYIIGLNLYRFDPTVSEIRNTTAMQTAIIKAHGLGIKFILLMNISKYNGNDYNTFHLTPSAVTAFMADIDFILANYAIDGIELSSPYVHYIMTEPDAGVARTFYNTFFTNIKTKIGTRTGFNYGFSNSTSDTTKWASMGMDITYINNNHIFTYFSALNTSEDPLIVSYTTSNFATALPYVEILNTLLLTWSTLLIRTYGSPPISCGTNWSNAVCWNQGFFGQLQYCKDNSLPFSINIHEKLDYALREYYNNASTLPTGATAGDIVKTIIGAPIICSALVLGAITIDNIICPSSILTGSHTLNIIPTGGQGTLKYNWVINNTPIGTSQTISWNPTTSGSYLISAVVSDSCSPAQTKISTCTVNVQLPCPALTLGAITIDNLTCPATVNTGTHNFSIVSIGGQGTLKYSWTVNNTSIGTTQSVSWSPTNAGTYGINVTVTDSCNPTQSKTVTCNITVQQSCSTLTVGTVLVDGSICPGSVTPNDNHIFTVPTAGGLAPLKYSWSVDGVVNSQTGSQINLCFGDSCVYGFGSHNISVTVTDSCGIIQSKTSSCTFIVSCNSLDTILTIPL